MHLITSAIHWT